MRKVLVIITTAFVQWGGLTNAYMNYYRAMNKEELIIDIASYNDPDIELINEIKLNGGKYIKLPDKRKKTLQYLISYSKLCSNYEVVHVHGNSASMVGELYIAKKKNVNVRIAHCHTNKCMHPFLNAICSPLFWKSYTVGAAVSKDAGKWLYKRHKYTVLNNAIDTHGFSFDEYARERIRKRYNVDKGDIVFGHVGKIYAAKNHAFLIKLFNKILDFYPNAKLMLVGDGVLKSTIEKQVNLIGLSNKVIFTGMQNDTRKFYSAFDYYLFPSIYEGFPLAVLEAQVSGLYGLVSDAVPNEVNVSGNIKHIKLDIDSWFSNIKNLNFAEYRMKRKTTCRQATLCAIKKGYDNKINSEILRSIYLS